MNVISKYLKVLLEFEQDLKLKSTTYGTLRDEELVSWNSPLLSMTITNDNQSWAWVIADKPDWKINRNVSIVLMNLYKVFFSLVESNWANHNFLGILCNNLFHVLLLSDTVIWLAGK